ncbi:hypothetical protein FACS189419_04940 [Planctomycetales bacterium]|nr:hypothetical protein FACS189419_04940 [Planctomycetales bacterium]
MNLSALTNAEFARLQLAIAEEVVRRLAADTQRKETPPEVPLRFDDTLRTIQWRGGEVKLGRKKYLIVKTVWKSKKHRASINEIEEVVWGVGNEKFDMFVERKLMSATVAQLQKTLSKSNFPYQLRTIKDGYKHQIKGFLLFLVGTKKMAEIFSQG